MIAALFFYLFSAMAVASAVMVISSRNPVHSVLFLILCFFFLILSCHGVNGAMENKGTRNMNLKNEPSTDVDMTTSSIDNRELTTYTPFRQFDLFQSCIVEQILLQVYQLLHNNILFLRLFRFIY